MNIFEPIFLFLTVLSFNLIGIDLSCSNQMDTQDSRVKAGYAHSREELVKKAIVHYLEDFDLSKRYSELFMETGHSAELLHNAWKQPVPADEALEILASVGRDLENK